MKIVERKFVLQSNSCVFDQGTSGKAGNFWRSKWYLKRLLASRERQLVSVDEASESLGYCGGFRIWVSEMGNKCSFVASIALIAAIFGASNGLGNVRIVEPEGQYVPLGKNVKLVCDYELEGDKLYLVQWFRYASEFYRFVPKQVPAGQAFPQSKLNVSETGYDARSVTILNVSHDVSGTYSCVVTVERSFEARSAAKNVTVVAVPDGAPEILEDSPTYHIGDTVSARCKVGFTTPILELSWYLNDQVLKNPPKKRFEVPETCTSSTGVGRKLVRGPILCCDVVEEVHFPVTSYVPFRISCEAKVGDVYKERSRSVLVQAQPRPVVPTEEPQELMAPTKSVGELEKELSTRLPKQAHEYGRVHQTSGSGRMKANWAIHGVLVCSLLLYFVGGAVTSSTNR